MGNCIPATQLKSFWKETSVIGAEQEGWEKLTVMLSASRKVAGVWVLSTDTMKEVDGRIRTKFRILDIEWAGETFTPKLMMHRFGRSATVHWDVTVEEAKSKYLRYHFYSDIAAEYTSAGDSITAVARRNMEPFVFTKEWLRIAENHHGDGIRDSTHIYEI